MVNLKYQFGTYFQFWRVYIHKLNSEMNLFLKTLTFINILVANYYQIQSSHYTFNSINYFILSLYDWKTSVKDESAVDKVSP